MVISSLRGSKARAGCPLVKELAKAAGVGSRTVENDEDDNGAPFRSLEEYLAWRSVNRAQRGSSSSGGDDLREQKLQAEIAKLKEEVRAKELANRVREGELVPRDAVERWLLSFAAGLKKSIESWPESLVKEVPGEVRLIVSEVAREQARMLLLSVAAMDSELWADEGVSEE